MNDKEEFEQFVEKWYESDSNDGVHPRMIEISAAEWDRVQAQLAAARAALEAAVQYVYDECGPNTGIADAITEDWRAAIA